MQRKIFIGGNWKCNQTVKESTSLVENVYNKIEYDSDKIDLLIAPISLHLGLIRDKLNKSILVSAQNVSETSTGAYTGEIAPEQLLDFGINWVIIGHSERRKLFGETVQTTISKAKLSLETGLNIIFCLGELLEDREAGKTNEVLEQELAPLLDVVGDKWENVVIAYEPVWAIGTGVTASPEQAQEAHKFLRDLIAEKVDGNVANNLRIIYGGSVKGSNCEELIAQEDVDGFLIGGASLTPDIATIVSKVQ